MYILWGFPGGLVGKNPPANAGDTGDASWIRESGRSPGEGNGSPLQYFRLENPMDRGAWQAIVHRVVKSQTQLLEEGEPLLWSKSRSNTWIHLSNTWKWIVQGDTHADKARDFIGKGLPDGEQEGKGTQGEPRNPGQNCSATWLAVSGFMVMGLISRLSLANHFDSESFLVVHALLSQDGC